MTFSDLFRQWGLQNIKLNIGFAELEFAPTEDDQTAAWDMYVELLTRVATQKLPDESGDEATALESVYSLFPTTREILKSKGRQATEFTKVAIVVLNQVERPFTAKWHKKKIEDAFSQENECNAFRSELRVLQGQLKCYSRLLADMAMVEDLTELDSEEI